MKKKKSFYNSLQFKIHLWMQFILITSFLILGYIVYISQLNFFIDEIRNQGIQQADMVAEESVTSLQRKSYYFLEELASRVELSPSVAYCQILDENGESLLLDELVSGVTRGALEAAYSADDVIVIERDIIVNDAVLGKVKVGMYVSGARAEVTRNLARLLVIFIPMLGIITAFLYFFLNRQLIFPVINLSKLTETISRGEFVTTTLDRRKDELGVLAQGFNTMSQDLREAYRDLEEKVDARTEDLTRAYTELQAIFENSLIGIAVLSSSFQIIRANSRFAFIFGYQTEEMSDLSLEELHDSASESADTIGKFMAQLPEKNIAQAEYTFRKKDGTIFWSQISAQALEPTDLDKGIILVLEDITDKKKANEMLRQHAEDLRVAKDAADKATRSKSEFLARMSHEIRTPMNAILGMAEMLQESDLNSEQVEYVKTFSSAGELLLGIINDILDFSKIEVGQIELELIPFSLPGLIEDVTKLFAYRAEEKGLKLTQSVSSELSRSYLGDPTRIRQIIINLLGNAVKFTNHGSVNVEVKPSVLEDGAACCLFSIKDTGVGIPQAKMLTIFESFTQADSSTTREFGGTGLGLAISKRLVELMGGRIWVESEVDQGTTFFFTVPLVEDTESKDQLSQLQPVQYALPEDLRLLILEDNPAQDGSVSSLIQQWNITSITRKTVGQAVNVLLDQKGKDFQAAIIDSEVNGFAALQIAHLLIGQGIDLPHLILVVDSAQEVEQILSLSEIAPVSYVLRGERDAGLLTRIKEIAEAIQHDEEEEADTQVKRLLLVDDVEANRRVVELFLKNMNVSLVHAENGKEAVEKFTEEPFDLVLMDMEMPVMDGLEATRRIRMWEQEKREFQTPIIALTAHAFQEHRQKTIDAGCTEFLAKPIKKQDLIDMVNQFSGKHAPLIEVSTTVQPIIPSSSLPEPDDSPVQIDPELEQLRPLFLRTVYDFQSQIADAITGNDFQTLQRCGHSLKGLGSTYGVDEISQAGRLIEAAAKERQTAIVAEAANHLAIFMNTGQTPKIQAEDKALPTTPEANLDGDRFVVHVAPDMSELIPFLMEGMQKDLIGMRQASVDQDFAALRRSGHDLKGFGTTYGFDYMLFLGSQIQLAADKQSAGEIARLLNILEDYLNRVDIIYDGGESLRDTDRPDSLSAQATVAEDSASTDSASTIVEVDQELYELVPLFLETMEKNIAEMDEALKYKQYEVICRHGHSQRGLGSTYGFDYIGDLGSKLELAGAQKDDNTISVLLEQMNEYLQKVHVVQKEG